MTVTVTVDIIIILLFFKIIINVCIIMAKVPCHVSVTALKCGAQL